MRALLLMVLSCVVAGGCQQRGAVSAPVSNSVDTAITTTAEPITRAETRNEIAGQQLAAAKPQITDQPAATHVETAAEQLAKQRDDLAEAKQNLIEARDTARQQAAQYQQQISTEKQNTATEQQKREILESQWYVVWGQYIETAIEMIEWAVMILIVLTIAGSAVKGMGGPVGMIGAVAYNICLNIWTLGTHAVGRLFRWLLSRWVGE